MRAGWIEALVTPVARTGNGGWEGHGEVAQATRARRWHRVLPPRAPFLLVAAPRLGLGAPCGSTAVTALVHQLDGAGSESRTEGGKGERDMAWWQRTPGRDRGREP